MKDSTPQRAALQLFEAFEVGVIHLDAQRHVLAMNDFARRVLPVYEKRPFNKMVLSFHPERSKHKVDFLLNQASGCPVANATPMAMIINIPEQVLLIKVTRLADEAGVLSGFVLVFYDITQVVASPSEELPAGQESPLRRLARIPCVVDHKTAFVEATSVLFLESEAHYTRVRTEEGFQFSNLSISDLSARLDPALFMRVHRRFLVNVPAIAGLEREVGKTLVRFRGERHPLVPVSRTEVAALRRALGLKSGR